MAHVETHSPLQSFSVPSLSPFVLNAGQLGTKDIAYYGEGGGLAIGFAERSVFLRISSQPSSRERQLGSALGYPPEFPRTGIIVRMAFEGANPVSPKGRGQLAYPTNFLLGDDPAKWRTGVPSYHEVVYENLYEGVDVVFRASEKGLKYEFLVYDMASLSRIRLAYEGVDDLSLGPDGMVRILTVLGELRDAAPVAQRDGRTVPCSYTPFASMVMGIRCADADGRGPLVVDPLVYSTFLGGAGTDRAWAVALDASGDAYVTGYTLSPDFPTTPGVFDPSANGSWDVFVTKLNATGTGPIYSTYLGGAGHDEGFAVTVGAPGAAFVAGRTRSPDFPTTPGAFDRTCGTDGNCDFDGAYYYDAFVAKLSPGGETLDYSTFLGGVRSDEASSMALDTAGAVYVTGSTSSPSFPTTPGAFDRTCGTDGNCDFDGLAYYPDAFLTKLSAAGNSLVHATYLGGGGEDSGYSVAVDPTGASYLTGNTISDDYPTTPGTFQGIRGADTAGDAFVTKVDSNGSALAYSTFLGGSGGDETGTAIVIDGTGNAYLAGMTYSADFPTTPGVFDTLFNVGPSAEYDLYLAKLNATGSALAYSTFLGGTGQDGWARLNLGVNTAGEAYVTGITDSPNFPTTPGAFDRTCGTDGNCDLIGGFRRYDAFLTKLTANASALIYSTFFGGQGDDLGRALTLDLSGDAYVVGGTSSIDFPATPGAFRSTPAGGGDAFVLKFAPLPDLAVEGVSTIPSPPVRVGTPTPIAVNVTNVGDVDAPSFSVLAFEDLDGDGRFDPGEDLGTQDVSSLPVFGFANLSYPWTPNTPGLHRLCGFADPAGIVREGNETNNILCTDVLALELVLGPDYAPADPQPLSPLAVGLALDVSLSVRVANVGNGSGNRTVTLALLNASTPTTPFSTFSVPALATASISGPFLASWRSPTVPGTHEILADVDYGDGLAEWNETNNQYAWTIEVVAGPITSLTVGQPSVTAAVTFVTSATPLAFSVLDQSGSGIRNTTYRLDGGPWVNFTATGPFALSGDGSHVVEWFSEDFAGNVEPVANATLVVDDTPPTTTVSIGDPKYVAANAYVASATPFSLAAVDGGASPAGMNATEYRIDTGPWTPYAGPFTLAGEGAHGLAFRSSDLLGNLEVLQVAAVIVDDTPPTTTLSVGDPKHVAAETFVTSATPLTLAAADPGTLPVGVGDTEYRVDGGPWTVYASPVTLAGEGAHTVEYRSADLLGNVESTQTTVFFVDDTLPAVTIEVGMPRHDGADTYVTSATPFTLTAIDEGADPVGLASVEFRVSGTWIPYGAPFTLTAPDGPKTVEVRATDLLGNAFAGQIAVVLDDTPPTTTPSHEDGTYPVGTAFAFTADDAGSGVARTEVRVDGGAWATYATPLALPEGDHTIWFRSVDNVGNVEEERVLAVTILGEPPPPTAVNWKPLVAAVFAAILVATGWRASWSRWESRGAAPRRARLKVFATLALPFVVAEAATGAVSGFTGLLSVPPVLGVGTAVDLGILAAGTWTAAYETRRWRSSEPRSASGSR